ncbi:MAG: hypothetical protein A2Z04_06905 [Chloroflexi bacterium RBG_16_57_9]|nr:MAG: hypothetical protein A2Z04_06905 [Chloroflexi bacterium RBG_16_57_9]
MARLRNEKADVRRAAVKALQALGAREALPELVARLRDEEADVRVDAAWALRALGAREAIPALVECLRDEIWHVRRAAALALVALRAREATPALVECLRDENLSVRWTAALALVDLGAREATPALVILALAGNYEARGTLATLQPEFVLLALRPLRAHSDWQVQQAVIPLYEQSRRKTGLPRERWAFEAGLTQAEDAFRARAALHALDTLAGQALILLPNWPAAVHNKAQILRRLGCPAAALEALTPGLSPDVWRGVAEGQGEDLECARCLYDLGRHDEALALVRQVQAEAGETPSLLSDCADLLAELGIAEEAEALYTHIIRLQDWAGYYRNRAAFYIRQGCHAEAEADIGRAAEKEPWHPNTFGRRGQLRLAQGRFTEALESFQEAARRDPLNVLWQYDLAFAHLGLDEQEQAVAALEQALARTELHEQVEGALQDLALLERARPDLPELAAVRERILERKALLDRLAEEEYAAAK